MKSKVYKRSVFFLFAFLLIIYIVEIFLVSSYLDKILRLVFPIMLIIIGILAYREKIEEVILELKKAKESLKEGYLATIKSLALAIEAKDKYTRGHSSRVVEYALIIADELGISEAEKENLKIAGILHDIGKIAIPDSILEKPGKLTEEEYEIIKKHPDLGVNILKPLSFLKPILPLILHHHERVDNNGYHHISNEKIPLASKILSVADSYDAMTSDRPYRKAYPKEKAIQELKDNSGTQFDPKVVEALLRGLEKRNL